jgi:coenzyme Q-binding protein COQ10
MPTHAEQRLLRNAPSQFFDLVADIEKYPEFLPWCVGARITKRDGDVIHADLIIGFKMIREKFTSRVTLSRPDRIDVEYLDGPFRYLNNHWKFIPKDGGCLIDFYVDFQFRSRVLRMLMEPLFNEAVRRMVAAFEARARQLYGAGKSAAPPAPSAPKLASGS